MSAKLCVEQAQIEEQIQSERQRRARDAKGHLSMMCNRDFSDN